MYIKKEQIIEALKNIKYPGTGKDIVSSGMIKDDIVIDENKVSFSITSTKKNDPFIKSIVKMAEHAIQSISADIEIKNNISIISPEPKKDIPQKLLPDVKNIIIVVSGKGGVGKSIVSSNIAAGLSDKGYKVGLLDANIYGPSIPKMFNIEDSVPELYSVDDKDFILPVKKHGVDIISIGFFINKQDSLMWRGTMAVGALKQLISDTFWGELDYFIIDLPPATSDIHLTLMQSLTITAAIIVTTPQKVTLLDMYKDINMLSDDKINIPIIGFVKNMSWFSVEENSSEKHYIFGKGECEKITQEFGINLLAEIPLSPHISNSADIGHPIVINKNYNLRNEFIKLVDKFILSVERLNKEQS